MFPPVSVIDDHFKAKDKTQTKQKCNDVVQHLFCSGKDGLLGAVAFCLFKAQSFYNEPTTILIYHKLCHAEALRTLHQRNKNTAFRHGGLYHGCKEAQRNMRDSLYLKSGGSSNDCRLVHRFHQLQLTSNNVFLDPELTAAHLFKTKSTHRTDTNHLKKLKRNVKSWINVNPNQPYINMSDDATSDDSQDKGQANKAEKNHKETIQRANGTSFKCNRTALCQLKQHEKEFSSS